MATKKKTPKEKAGTVTVGTRFDDNQKELLERAAKAANCTVAKLVRDAALQKAVAVVNSSGASEIRLRQLAEMLANHLSKAEIEIRGEGLVWDSTITALVVKSPLYEEVPAETKDGSMFLSKVNPKLEDEIKEATRTCGPEFARFFKEALFDENKHCGDYKLKLDPDEYL
jgi:uncharacterized protein (DUF1778 family)